MSNSLAIAAVTATLRNLLHVGITTEPDLADASVTMQPLDRARANGSSANQLNLFLYHVIPSPTWKNMNLPGQVRQGESSFPPLGLNLYYILTAFGRDNDTQGPFSHQLMGRAMSVLNDHPLLGSAEIKAALPDNDLWNQLERVRLTLQPYSIEEIAKLWTGFQTQYRLSVAYEAAVVLIDSNRPSKMPLPILTRGPADSGVTAQGNVLSPFAALAALILPNNQTTAKLGDTISLTGQNLSGDVISVQFFNPLLAAPVVIAAATASDQQISVAISNKPTEFVPGVYTVSVQIQTKGVDDVVTDTLPLAIAPKITGALPLKVTRVKRVATINIKFSPNILPGQRVSLLLADQEIQAAAITAATNQLSFVIPTAVPGTYRIRLRVDGVDSQMIDRTTTPPQFDETQKVIIT